MSPRPKLPEVTVTQLLQSYEETAVAKRRRGKPSPPSYQELADAENVAKSAVSVKSYCRADVYNLPWPLFRLDEAVCLMDALRPDCEFLYVNPAWSHLTGWQSADLLHKPYHLVLAPGQLDPEVARPRRELAAELRAGRVSGTFVTQLVHKTSGDLLCAEVEMRYGPRSDAYFVRVLHALHQPRLDALLPPGWIDLFPPAN